ncbi:hypothetical protein E4T56_gene13581, partial [Termitomyces sp. T112]
PRAGTLFGTAVHQAFDMAFKRGQPSRDVPEYRISQFIFGDGRGQFDARNLQISLKPELFNMERDQHPNEHRDDSARNRHYGNADHDGIMEGNHRIHVHAAPLWSEMGVSGEGCGASRG